MRARARTDVALATHSVARIACCSFDDLLRLGAPRSSALVIAADQAAADVAETATRLCAELFGAVPRVSEPAARRLLINAQRDVFNRRPLKTAGQIRPLLSDGQVLADYVRAVDAAMAIDREADAVFAAELANIRETFRELLRGEVMQDALALSSVKLLESLDQFYLVRAEPRGKDLDAEIGAAKYFSRAAGKTSPFSKFTALAPVVVGEASAPIRVGRESMALQSSVRLNARILFMLQSYLRQDRAVRVHLPLRLNATLAATGAQYRFLTSWNNVEAFQQISAHPAIDFAIERLRSPLAWRELEAAIAEAFECDANEATALVEKLLAVGLIEVDLAVSGSDPDWDLALGAFLRGIAADAPAAGALAEALAQARRDTEAFARAHGLERIGIRDRIVATFAAAMPSVEGPSVEAASGGAAFEHRLWRNVSMPSQFALFEDATLDLQMRVRADDAQALAGAASRLVDAFASFDVSLEEREQAEAFFLARYGAGATVPLLTLYEDYYRHRKESGPSAPAPEQTRRRTSRNDEALARLKAMLKPRVSGDVVHVTSADLDALGLTDDSDERPRSYAAVVQCFADSRGVLCGVLNGLGPGFGKVTNRFLHLLPSDTTEEMRERHERMSGDAIFAEAVDASYFNANIHPPLMPFEIAVPGGQTSLPPARQIRVGDLAVRAGAAGLHLRHVPSGKRVFAFDCGLQRLASRSKLYQLLASFSPCGQPTIHPLLQAVNRAMTEHAAERGAALAEWPRIVFDDRLVLQRRRWDVPRALLPARPRGESAASWFRRVGRWRRGLGLPRHVFARIGFRDLKDAKAKHRDDSKPQLVSFDSPLLVSVFEKMLVKVETVMELSEMLPAPDQLMDIAGKRYVTEHVFQWYRGLD